ncbi:RhuM family protein [Phascolarctobacterium succinatutens]|uniref:RhuM family protein n=1 Tax=Phascolarctobacterium succinatutens TaxID=626940 RepID=UPI003F65D8B6
MNFLHIANSNKPLAFYSLDVILAVGFRIRSPHSTQFRHRANNTFSVNPTDYLKNTKKRSRAWDLHRDKLSPGSNANSKR